MRSRGASDLLFSRCGGIGRHAVLRGQWRKPCRFESGHRHHNYGHKLMIYYNDKEMDFIDTGAAAAVDFTYA